MDLRITGISVTTQDVAQLHLVVNRTPATYVGHGSGIGAHFLIDSTHVWASNDRDLMSALELDENQLAQLRQHLDQMFASTDSRLRQGDSAKKLSANLVRQMATV